MIITYMVVLVEKNLPANAGDTRDADVIHGLGRVPGAGNGNPLQYSCLEKSRDKRQNSMEEPGRLPSVGPQKVRHD